MYQKILLGVDGSDHSKRAAEASGELARLTDGEVQVVHIVEYTLYGARGGALPAEHMPESTAVVDEVVKALDDKGVKASGNLEWAPAGRVANALIEDAKLREADLIVIGSRGLGDFTGLLLGSVSHKLVHLAPCPVLVVH